MADFPSYLKSFSDGSLEERIENLQSLLNPCMLCPRQCRVNRAAGEMGFCKAPYEPFISSARLILVKKHPL